MAKARQNKTRRVRVARSKKLGRPYEEGVCDLFRLFLSEAVIEPGVWVAGPDGRRELDVQIVASIDGRRYRGVVECKDFNPAKTGPVGIHYVDALDSKRNDLALDFAIVCSNAGFTADAISKANRVGIGLLSAARRHDARIRFGIVERIYVRHIGIKSQLVRYWSCANQADVSEPTSADAILFGGRPILNWLNVRLIQLLGMNPVVQGQFQIYCRLKAPITIELPGGCVLVEKIGMDVELEGAWFAQTITIDSTAALFNWLRRRMRLAPGEHQLHMVGVDYFGGEWISHPPMAYLADKKLVDGELDTRLLALKNSIPFDGPPHLDAHIEPEDMDMQLRDIPKSAIESVPGFSAASAIPGSGPVGPTTITLGAITRGTTDAALTFAAERT